MSDDTLGHLAYVALAAGQFSLARGLKLGWWLRFAGELGWVIIGVRIGMPSIYLWGSLFMVIDLYGAMKRSTQWRT